MYNEHTLTSSCLQANDRRTDCGQADSNNCKQTTRRQQSAGSGGARFPWEQHGPHVITKAVKSHTSQVRERPTWAEEWAHSVGREPRTTSKKMRAAGRQTPHVISQDCGNCTVVRERLTSVRRTSVGHDPRSAQQGRLCVARSPRSGARADRVDNWVTWWLQLKVSENGRLKTRAEEECGNKPRCGLYSPIHVDMDMGVRVVKRPLYTAHVGAGAFLWKTGKRHGKWRFHNVSTG